MIHNPDQLAFSFPEYSPEIRGFEAKRRRPKMQIQIRQDRETDALSVRFSDTPVVETSEVRPGVMFDYDADGRIVGMEILDASRTVAAGDMKKLALEVA